MHCSIPIRVNCLCTLSSRDTQHNLGASGAMRLICVHSLPWQYAAVRPTSRGGISQLILQNANGRRLLKRSMYWRRGLDGVIRSLHSHTHREIVSNLGKFAENIKGTFTCGGHLESSDPIELVYRKRNGEWAPRSVVFPKPDEDSLKDLVEACSPATFGQGETNVYDKNYRDAVALERSMFTTNFELCSSSILRKIQSLLLPNESVHTIRAEPYKLNIYTTGGHFKLHVDTPRSTAMFGSLVVCLPSRFSGGQLVTRHGGNKICYDWSSAPDKPPCYPEWAAFYSDVEHEILPVTEGHRVTMTFNLYSMDVAPLIAKDPKVDFTLSPFYHELRSAIRNPAFMKDGGVLGFPCQHSYVAVKKQLNKMEDLPVLLKGSDNVVYSVAKLLSLAVRVKPVVTEMNAVLDKFREVPLRGDVYESGIEAVQDLFDAKFKSITWATRSSNPDKDRACVFIHFGNECSLDYVYQQAAILIKVPKWCEERRNCGSVSGRVSNDGTPPEKRPCKGNKTKGSDSEDSFGRDDEGFLDDSYEDIF